MSAQKHVVALEQSAVMHLKKIVRSGTQKARTIMRAHILLMANNTDGTGKTDREICLSLGVCLTTPQDIRMRYVRGGLRRALYDAPRPGKPKTFTPGDEATVVALACTDAPKGHARWTLNLLQEKLTDQFGKSISRNTVDKILLKNDCKPWHKKNVVYSGD